MTPAYRSACASAVAPARRSSGTAPGPVLAAVVSLAALACAGCSSDTPIVKDVPLVRDVFIASRPFPEGWRVVDLTLPLDGTIPHAANPKQFPFERMDLPPADRTAPRTGAFTAMEHAGTHIASPRTRSESGATIETFGGADLLLPLVVIDVPSDAATEAPINDGAVRADERERGSIPRGAAVVLRTRAGPRADVHPGWSPAAIRWLVAERGARVLGSDAPEISPSRSGRDPAQAVAAGLGVWSLVSLDSLETLPPRGAWIVIGALPIVGGAGAPARVVALVPPDSTEVQSRDSTPESTLAGERPAER